MALSQTSSSRTTSDLIGLLPVNLESQDVMNAVDGATIERRTRISRPGDESARCKVLNALERKDFSQYMQQSTTHSTSNVISHRQQRTEPFGPRRCRHGTKSSPRREADVPAELLRALFGNVTKPSCGLLSVCRRHPRKLGFRVLRRHGREHL